MYSNDISFNKQDPQQAKSAKHDQKTNCYYAHLYNQLSLMLVV